jgi:hypothetical protein
VLTTTATMGVLSRAALGQGPVPHRLLSEGSFMKTVALEAIGFSMAFAVALVASVALVDLVRAFI